MKHAYFVVLAVLPALVGCPSNAERGSDAAPSGSQTSPNASILPAPLASASELLGSPPDAARGGMPADSAGRLMMPPDAGAPPPVALRVDEEPAHDTLTARDGNGITLDAAFRWYDVPAHAPGNDVNTRGIGTARKKTELRVSIDLGAAGRMRVQLASATFPLPPSSELRGRVDRYGHALVWPDAASYRLLAPGALRTMFAERRADVTPLVAGTATPAGKGTLLGLATQKTKLVSPAGTLTLEQARLREAGPAGQLLCRLLVELAQIDPSVTSCEGDDVPLGADFAWTGGGRFGFEVDAVMKRNDLPVGWLLMPPAGARFLPSELPPETSGVLLTREELADFRSGRGEPPKITTPGAPGEGVIAVNHTDALRWLLLDGVAVAWVSPRQTRYVIGPRPGRYVLGWRDFLGTSVEPPKTVELPARVTVGAPPDGG